MRSGLFQSLREYLSEIRRAYYTFVFGGVLAIAGAVGLFLSSQRWVFIASAAGMILGVLTAPLQAFHSMRLQRDLARGQDPYGRLRLLRGFANALSGGNWGIDHFASPPEDGFAVRIVVGARYEVKPDHEFDTSSMRLIRDRIANSALERWLRTLPTAALDTSQLWDLASPSNDYVVTVKRKPVLLTTGGSAVYARLTVQTPRSWGGVWPMLLLDVVMPTVYEDGTSVVQYPGAVPLAGETFQLELVEFVGLLETLAETAINELAGHVFTPLVARRFRERLFRRRLRLIGPNFDARAKPTGVTEAIRLPQFKRLSTQAGDARFVFETPDAIDAADRAERLEMLRRALRLFLRRQEYIEFESYVETLVPDTRQRPKGAGVVDQVSSDRDAPPVDA